MVCETNLTYFMVFVFKDSIFIW